MNFSLSEETKDKIFLCLFICSLVFLSFGYGIVAGIWELPPASQVKTAFLAARDIQKYWKNDFGLELNRHLVPAYPDRQERFSVIAADRMGNNNLLIAGLTPEREVINSVILYNKEGEELHVWPVDYAKIDPGGTDPENVFMHGLEVFEDGSIIVNFDGGFFMARLDACGNVMWKTERSFHHAVTRSYDGTLWSIYEHKLVQLNPENGSIIRETDLLKDVMPSKNLQGILAILSPESDGDLVTYFDPLHINHIEVLSPDMAKAFPMFAAGDLLISLRNVNLVAVLDPETFEFKWHQTGPWHRQHSPHFLNDGSIVVYNNNMNFNKSQIMKVFPATGRTEVIFEGSEEEPFYSWRRGKEQVMDNGNLLIVESEHGRAFMVTPDGELVWEYNNVYDETRNGVLSNAISIPPGFFNQGALKDCG
jgi:outer membrane protein assembly factor BamB